MKIAIICGRDIRKSEDTDGGSVLVRNLARELLGVGHSVEIFVPSNTIGGSMHSRSYADEVEDEFTITRFPIDLSGLDLESGSSNPHSYFLNRIAISDREADFFQNNALLEYDRVYIVHLAHAFGLVSRDLVPINRTVVFPMMLGSFYGAFESVPSEYIDRERRTLERVLHIATVSDAEKEVLVTEYGVAPTKIYKVGRGYDARVFTSVERQSFPKGQITILCANVIKPQKDQWFFIDLVSAAQESGLDLHVYLVGVREKTHRKDYNEYAKGLREEVVRRGMEKQITFIDVLPQNKLSEFMKSCAVAVYPSRTETFGKSVLESMATGLPTIVFDDVPAFREFIRDGHSGCIVPRSTEAVINALKTLRSDANLYNQISKNGIEAGCEYSWRKIIDGMLESEVLRMSVQ